MLMPVLKETLLAHIPWLLPHNPVLIPYNVEMIMEKKLIFEILNASDVKYWHSSNLTSVGRPK
jgi:hypothetical protein